MPPTKTNDKASEKKYTIDLSHDIEYQGVVYEKGRSVDVPRGLAILQGAVEADPVAETTVLAPETVQSQVQTQIGDLVTRLQTSERNAGLLQSQLDAARADREQVANAMEDAYERLEAVQAEAERLQEDNKAQAARITVLEAAAPKPETGLTTDAQQPAQN